MDEMPETEPVSPLPVETDADRLRGLLAPDALSVGIVSALAGDRTLTEPETLAVNELFESRGGMLFSDMLYAVTHQFFPPVLAESLWRDILQHKLQLSRTLGRNVRVTVATLDYLSNLKSEMEAPTLITEGRIAEIANLSMRDGLTGLFNHTSFNEILDLELRSHVRYGKVVSLILFDIDDFKIINDRRGHQEGDRILVELSEVLRSSTRDSDVSCRYGGEEFAAILPFTGVDEAREIAERIRQGAERLVAGDCRVSVSCGVAACGGGATTSQTLVRKADLGLYQAKRGGKNRIVVIE